MHLYVSLSQRPVSQKGEMAVDRQGVRRLKVITAEYVTIMGADTIACHRKVRSELFKHTPTAGLIDHARSEWSSHTAIDQGHGNNDNDGDAAPAPLNLSHRLKQTSQEAAGVKAEYDQIRRFCDAEVRKLVLLLDPPGRT